MTALNMSRISHDLNVHTHKPMFSPEHSEDVARALTNLTATGRHEFQDWRGETWTMLREQYLADQPERRPTVTKPDAEPAPEPMGDDAIALARGGSLWVVGAVLVAVGLITHTAWVVLAGVAAIVAGIFAFSERVSREPGRSRSESVKDAASLAVWWVSGLAAGALFTALWVGGAV